MLPSDTHIGLFRVRANEKDLNPINWRLRVEALLADARWQAADLSLAAILCVRTLPCRIRAGTCNSFQSPKFRKAITAVLDDMARSAARPALGAVPANTEAVLFADQSELLACLASDWCEEMVGERWWWRTLFKFSDVKRMVLEAWLKTPECVPAAFERLLSMGKAVPFAAKINAAVANALLSELVDKFALTQIKPALATVLGGGGRGEADGSRSDEVADQMENDGPPAPPWRLWMTENVGGGLTLEQHCLLGISISLTRAPVVARSPGFAGSLLRWGEAQKQNLVDWQVGTFTTSPKGESPSLEARSDGVLRPLVSGIRNRNSPAGPAPFNSMLVRSQERDKRRIRWLESAGTAVASTFVHGALDKSGFPVVTESSIMEHHSVVVKIHDHEGISDPIVPSSPVPLAEPLSAPDAGRDIFLPVNDATIDTELGGLFYLVNVGIILGLYSDFTRPLNRAPSLLIWDFIALTGRELLGENAREDPLWQLLAQLAGRSEHETLERDFDPPDHWRLPTDWLAPFPEHETWRWTVSGRRLQVWHPQGFFVIDQTLLHRDPMTQLMRETEEYRETSHFDLEPATSDSPSLDKLPLDRWLGWIMPYLRARLSCALGLAAGTNITGFLCRQKARVSVTPSHVDIFFALDQHPIEIRLAGLDRNPGWVPSAGRFIAFHYQ